MSNPETIDILGDPRIIAKWLVGNGELLVRSRARQVEDSLELIVGMRFSRFILRRLYEFRTLPDACAFAVEFCPMIIRSNAVHIDIPALKVAIHEPLAYFSSERHAMGQKLRIPLDIHACRIGTLVLYFDNPDYRPNEVDVMTISLVADYLAQLAYKSLQACERVASLTMMDATICA